MALADGQACLPSSFAITNAAGAPAQIQDGVGSSLTFYAGGTSAAFVNNVGGGGDFSGAVMREVQPGTATNFGRRVQLTNKGTAFRGVTVAALQIELGTTGGTGALTQCVLVVPDDPSMHVFIARVSDVTFLD